MTVAAWIWHMVYQAARRVMRAFCRVVREQTTPMAPQRWGTTAGHNGPRKATGRGRDAGGGDGDGDERREPTNEKERRRTKRSPRRQRKARAASSSSSSSSCARKRRQRRMKESQAYLYEHDPAYRAWKDELTAKQQEDNLRKQGQVLADALGQKLDAIVTSTSAAAAAAAAAARRPTTALPEPVPYQQPFQQQQVPYQQCQQAGQQQHQHQQLADGPAAAGTAASPAAGSAHAAATAKAPPPLPPPEDQPAQHLSSLQCRWLEAELGHRLSLQSGDPDAVRRTFTSKQADRNLATAFAASYRRFLPGIRQPRSFASKVDAIVGFVMQQ